MPLLYYRFQAFLLFTWNNYLRRHSFRLLVLALLGVLVHQKDIDVRVGASGEQTVAVAALGGLGGSGNSFVPQNFWGKLARDSREQLRGTPSIAAAVPAGQRKQRAYLQRYANLAITEMRRSGVPASITLAQALLESSVGESKLATRNNNHFGIKCFSRKCQQGHCSNFTDDSHKDFFRIYPDATASFRAHSQFLRRGKRYAGLFRLTPTDYKAWAHGLKRAGYATDKRYAHKLIRLIEELDLARYDG